jgi:hypothetical protein
MRKISGFMFWVLLGIAVVLVPLACGSNDNINATDANPDSMTKT